MTYTFLNGIWPEWEIVRRIGSGSYGVVYEAKKKDQLDTRAAVKVISIPQNESELDSLLADGMTEEASRTYMENVKNDFVSEIQLMYNFKATQNIVSIEDYAVVEKTDQIGWDIYIRMELLTPFTQYISTNNITEDIIIKLGIDMCNALELCEKNNVIHRDIKPENIFVNKYGDFKLGDFGIARKLENVTGGLSQKGSFNYMAPEVIKGSRYDNRVDICSLGLVLYKLANNNCLPFIDPNKQLLTPDERARATQRRLDGEPFPPACNASKALSDAIMCACTPNPNYRFTTATAMKSALTYAAENKEQAVNAENTGNKTQRLNVPRSNGNLGSSRSTFSDQWNGTSGYQTGGQWNNYSGYGYQSGGSWNSARDYRTENEILGNQWGNNSGSGSYSDYRIRYSNDRDNGNNGWKVFFAVFFALLAVMVIILLFISQRNDSDDTDEPNTTESVTENIVEEETGPSETVYPTVNVTSTTTTPTPTVSTEPTSELNTLIKSYLTSFVYDVNYGNYNKLSGCVQSGSSMEKTQKAFIADGVERGLEEDLIEYTISSRTRIDDFTYHITVVETYEIWQDIDPEHQIVTQKCVYKVCKQRDGTWKMVDFVGDMEVTSREEL